MNLQTVKTATLIALALTTSTTFAETLWPDAATITGGYWKGQNTVSGVRGSVRWDWPKTWFVDKPVALTGYWEPGVGYWHASDIDDNDGRDHDNLWIFSYSPVFELHFPACDNAYFSPFIEFGIGGSYFTASKLGKKDFGGHFQFEDRVGVGFYFAQRQGALTYRYMHYSNAGIYSNNSGLDLNTLSLTWFF